MSNIQNLKRRIKSAKNIKQITKAMEMVAASKMLRAQKQALSARPYARKLQETLQTIAHLASQEEHPLLEVNQTGIDCVVLVSTDKSLAGSLNSNLFRGTHQYLEDNHLNSPEFIIVGKKANQFVSGFGYELTAQFTDLPDPVAYADTLPLSQMLIQGYLKKEYHSVTIIYMDFISTLVQKIRIQPLLPIDPSSFTVADSAADTIAAPTDTNALYQFEPSSTEILDWLLPYYIETTIYQILIEAKASEHSARMVSMKNASDNAGEIIKDLTLSFNKQRQAKITAELLDNTIASMNLEN